MSIEAKPNLVRIKENKQIRRGRLAGTILRSLGHCYCSAELAEEGVKLAGGSKRLIPFIDFSAPAMLKRTLGFPSITLPVKGAAEVIIAGIRGSEANEFILSLNGALCAHFSTLFKAAEGEMIALAEVLTRLSAAKRYPAACLLAPFLVRAQIVLQSLPASFPDGALDHEQQKLFDTIVTFVTAPERTREAAKRHFIENELFAMAGFFDRIESNPLTPEQRLSIVTDEDATLVLAGAGSGKTSVIVAKAAYLIEREIRRPEEILLMAFGKGAAAEMSERIKQRAGAEVDALTFHALGYKIIAEVEGSAPALAAHASDDAQFRKLLREILVDEVMERSGMKNLILKWFAEFYWPYKSQWDFKALDEYYQYVEAHELRTLQGEYVRSFEELEIANWLYLNGIAYEYEPIYEHNLPENNRRAYTPDFKLTESGIYIEHFGVRKSRGSDRLVTAPYIDCERYLEDMAWKRKVHEQHGTTLVETYSYERVEGRLIQSLSEKLAPYANFKPMPADAVFGTLSEMGRVDSFTQTLGTFLRHFKSSGASIATCEARAEDSADKIRTSAFLKLFEALLDAYEKRLGDRTDFEDMIVRASQHVESGRYKSPYRHLLVDEFQDISAGRARLLKALKAQHDDARIFAVGDDWQSIYRFTGSDIHLMRHFGEEFGGELGGESGVHSVVDLGRTFRSVEEIAVPARKFVLQNPSQIKKQVVTNSRAGQPAIRVAYYEPGQHASALRFAVERVVRDGGSDSSVLLLGRYHFVRPENLDELSDRFEGVTLRFMTVHASKGLEADHVIILRATAGEMGFPSEIVDDPILDLVLPEPERFDHAEERRLFYVALTRARKSVTVLADREKPSAFVRELIRDEEFGTVVLGDPGIAEHRCGACGGRMLSQTSKSGGTSFMCEHRRLCGQRLKPCGACGQDLPVKDKADPANMTCSCGAGYPVCPECDDGWLVPRHGRYGRFLGCVNYPSCTGKQQLSKQKAG